MELKVRKLVSVVCPLFNDERAVPLFYSRLVTALKTVEDRVRFEYLFVNDRSADQTAEEVRRLRERDPRVQLLTLSRTFGTGASVFAGLRHATGDAVVVADVGCEDPPELVPQFIERWLAGADVVYGKSATREKVGLGARLGERLTRLVSDHDIAVEVGTTFLADKRVRDAMLATRSTFPYLRAMLGFAGFAREGIAYQREKRVVGEPRREPFHAAQVGLTGVLSTTTAPLRALGWLGATLVVVDAATALAALVVDLASAGGLLRWIAALVLLNLGAGMGALGLLAVYLARTYRDVMSRPVFVVDDKLSTMEGRRR